MKANPSPRAGGASEGGAGPDLSARTGAPAVLQRDLGRFLADLSIALHKFAIYPCGHPALTPVLETLARRTDALLQDRPRFAFGVARDRLVIEGVMTDERHPLLSSLAERLHRHHLAAVSFYRGVSITELSDVVAAMSEDPKSGGGPLGTRPPHEMPSWPHVNLHPLTVSCLEIVAGGDPHDAAPARSAELWVGLAQASLAGDPSASRDDLPPEPTVVARAIDEHPPAEAYDQVIVGYLQQIAEEVRTSCSPDALELRRRVSTLVSAMQPETRQRLLSMGGDAAQRRRFISNAACAMSAAAVVDLVKAAAEASNEALSNGLVRLLTKLSAHADAGDAVVRPLADSALRLQVNRLTYGCQAIDPNPADYTELLQRLAKSSAPGSGSRDAGSFADALRVLEMCIEIEDESAAAWRSLASLVDNGEVPRLLEVVGPPAAHDGLAGRVSEALVSGDTVRSLLAKATPDMVSIDALLPHLQGAALDPLFELLADSPDRHVRRAAFDRLRRAGGEAAARAVQRLRDADGRWHVLRNLLALLAETGHLPADCDPAPWLAHSDGRVRREALRVALRLDGLRDRAIGTALDDEDERVVHLALTAAVEHPSAGVTRRLFELAGREGLDDGLRAKAIEALGKTSRHSETRELLFKLAGGDGRPAWWRRHPRTAAQSAAAALTALAANWPNDPRVAAAVGRAASPADRPPPQGGAKG